MGNYTQGKRTGQWRFYNDKGHLMQIYNYDTDSLKFEAREYANTSDIGYAIDRVISDTDKATKPIKAGGRYYGYLPYLGLFKVPFSTYQYDVTGGVAVIELLISPLGRLADYKVHAVCGLIEYDQTVTMDVKLFKEEDRKFIPATFNGAPVMSRILIKCRITQSGGLDFL
jgi:antitoxin component YwqK of YwqJK toxin-antitoxin module